MAEKRVSIQVYMSSETRRKLRVLAAERDISINDLMRDTLQKGFEAQGVEIDMSEGIEERGGWKGGPKEKREAMGNE